MSFTAEPALVPDRERLPLKKRDQRLSSPAQQQQQQSDAATFKAPYPYKSHSETKTKHTNPFQSVPRRVPALHQPWIQSHPSTRSRPHDLAAFRDHHGWAEWRQFNPLHPGLAFSHHYQHHGHFSGLHLGHPHRPPRFSPFSLEGFQRGNGWEQLKTFRDKVPYVRRRERKGEHLHKASPPSLSTCLPHCPQEDLSLQHDKSGKVAVGHSFIRVPPDAHSSSNASMKEDVSRPPALPRSEQASSSSSSSTNHFPWLLPHFVAGSLIELRDGRLRRVEHLQTEDFLLGSLACPDLRLSCCTVQSISPSASSSSSISRLLILLHDQQSQELVDVYVEYPFFVRGKGWSSCSPQRTARLCGLHCCQLSVGDICLALTPVSTPRPPPSATLDPEGGSLKAAQPLGPSAGEQKTEAEVRRRHYSAPELRGSGTNDMQ